jgi:branched-chain amino acid aminotransferase
VNVSLVRAKASGYYINSILANQEVTAHGYDEALLLDTDGYVSEGSGENVFIVKNGKLYTPDLASCLDGITRDAVMTMAKDLGVDVIEKRITRDEMYCADEAFFTGTAAEVTPIRELDDRTIGSGQRGPITEKLQRMFFDAVSGKATQYRHWIYPVA